MKNCNKCGAELEEGALYCGSCGAEVNAAPEAPASEEPVQAAEAPVQTTVVPAPEAPEGGNSAGAKKPDDDGLPVSLGTWICRDLLMLIPCVGGLIYIIMLFVWAFDTKYNSTSRNWAKGKLIFIGISLALVIVALIIYAVVFAVIGTSVSNELPYHFRNEFNYMY